MMTMMTMTLSLSKDAPGSYIYIFKKKNLHSLPPPPFSAPLSRPPFPNDERTNERTTDRPAAHTRREREIISVGGCCATTTSTGLALALALAGGGGGVGVGVLATTTPTMNDIDNW